MKALSQRDPRWSNLPLGNQSRVTIGSHGCVITTLAMLTGTTPNKINAEKSIFTRGGALVVWANLVGKFGITNALRIFKYNNQVALDVIARNGGVLVCVTPRPIGGTSGDHWVLFIGGGRLIDPWDGKKYPTSRFLENGTFRGMAVVDVAQRQTTSNSGSRQSLPGTVSGGGVTLQKIRTIDERTGEYRII